jgi:ribonuclease HI
MESLPVMNSNYSEISNNLLGSVEPIVYLLAPPLTSMDPYNFKVQEQELVTSPKGESVKYVLQMHFSASNNAAEYEALLHSLRVATALSIHRLRVLGDSLLVINQTNKEWSCLDDKIMMYCQKLRKLKNNFDDLEYLHILWGKNEVADELAKLSSSQAMIPLGVFMQELNAPSIAKALAKASKVAESSQETTLSILSIFESSEVMKFTRTGVPYSWYTSGQRAWQRIKTNMNDCIIKQDITFWSMTSYFDEALMLLWCDVYCQTMDALFSKIFTQEFAAVTQVHARLWENV